MECARSVLGILSLRCLGDILVEMAVGFGAQKRDMTRRTLVKGGSGSDHLHPGFPLSDPCLTNLSALIVMNQTGSLFTGLID